MICYKDMTFCTAMCSNMTCERNQKHIPKTVELPVAVADFKENCKIYRPEPT